MICDNVDSPREDFSGRGRQEPHADKEIRDFVDRAEISGAIHARDPLSIEKRVRARKIIVAYPSLKDRIRYHLSKTKMDSVERKKEIEDVIHKIGCPFGNSPQGGELNVSERHEYNETMGSLAKAIRDSEEISTEDYVTDAIGNFLGFFSEELSFFDRDVMARMDDLRCHYDESIGLRMRVRREQFSHNHSIQIIEDLTERNSGSDQDKTNFEAARRTFQKFPLDALTSLAEVVAPTDRTEKTCTCASTLVCERTGEVKQQHTGKVCRRGLRKTDEGSERYRIERELTSVDVKPGEQPAGGLFCCADVWVIPVADFIELLQTEPSLLPGVKPGKAKAALVEYGYASARGQLMYQAKRKKKWLQGPALRRSSLMRMNPAMHTIASEMLKKISAHLRDWFDIRDDDDNKREDFVFSFVSDGRAILAADLRPFKNENNALRFTDDQSRIVLIDLAMFREERGRILQRLMDIEAFRHLGLRGFPYAHAAFNAVTTLGVSLTRISGHQHARDQKTENVALEKKLKGIDVLSQSLDMLNQFFTYGINGKADSTHAYSAQIRNNLNLLRESRIPGYQTFSGYMERYFTAAHQIELLRSRYNNLRSRLIGATNLLNAQFNQSQIQELARSSKYVLRLTFLAVGIALFVGVIEVVNYFGQETNDSESVSTRSAETGISRPADAEAGVARPPQSKVSASGVQVES